MDIFEARVSEFAGRTCAERIPQSCAVDKFEYIKDRKENVAKIDIEINELEKSLNMIKDKESYFYKSAVKRLEKCREIKRNCEYSIALAKAQMKINKR